MMLINADDRALILEALGCLQQANKNMLALAAEVFSPAAATRQAEYIANELQKIENLINKLKAGETND